MNNCIHFWQGSAINVSLMTLVYQARQWMLQYSLAKNLYVSGDYRWEGTLLTRFFFLDLVLRDLFSWQQFCVWQELSPEIIIIGKEENLFTNQINK